MSEPRWLTKYMKKQEKAKGRLAPSPEALQAIKKHHPQQPEPTVNLDTQLPEPVLDQKALDTMVAEMRSHKLTPKKDRTIESELSWEEKCRRLTGMLNQQKTENKDLRRINDAYRKNITELHGLVKALKGEADPSAIITDERIKAKARFAKSQSKKLRELALDIHAIVNGFKGRTEIRRELREIVWEKYAVVMNMGTFAQCCHCGKLIKYLQMSVDHLKPRALGGTDDLYNLRPACAQCNWDRPLEDISDKFFIVGGAGEEETEGSNEATL